MHNPANLTVGEKQVAVLAVMSAQATGILEVNTQRTRVQNHIGRNQNCDSVNLEVVGKVPESSTQAVSILGEFKVVGSLRGLFVIAAKHC